MNAIRIVVESSSKCVGFACEKCQRFWSLLSFGGANSEESVRKLVDECCVPKVCAKHDKPISLGWTVCDLCRSEAESEKEAALFEKAKKVPLTEYDGEWLFRDGFGREGYFDADDAAEQEDDDGPIAWAWGCTSEVVTAADVDLSDYVSETLLADHHEAASDYVDHELLKQAAALIVEACKSVKSYHQDQSVVVLLGEQAASEAECPEVA